jgi:hypothetical protein
MSGIFLLTDTAITSGGFHFLISHSILEINSGFNPIFLANSRNLADNCSFILIKN